jgi:hypothetical protein
VTTSRAGDFKVQLTEGGLYNFLTSEESQLADLLGDETWCNKVAFLEDISQALNTVNKSNQGKNKIILTCTDKINPLRSN